MIREGSNVSWNWGNGTASGEVEEVGDEIAGLVKPTVRGMAEWIGYEVLLCQIRSVEIAARKAVPANVQFAGHAYRCRL